jgi:hypothetical protein
VSKTKENHYDKVFKDGSKLDEVNTLLDGYYFDIQFCEVNHDEDGSGEAIFRLLNDNGDDYMYLILYNNHNGYYNHGFDFTWGDDHTFIERWI